MPRAVITGLGVTSAFGIGARAFFGALEEGRSAVGPICAFDASAFPVRVAGEVPVQKIRSDWLAKQATELGDREARSALFEAWERDGMLRDRKIGLGVLAALEAWAGAGLAPSNSDVFSIIAVGLEIGFLDDLAAIYRADGQGRFDWDAERSAPLPRVRLRSPVNLPAECIHRALGLTGPLAIEVSACAAGALVIARGASLIERGAADVVLAGATDSMVNPMAMGAFWKLGAPSPRAAPDACRPFDRRRDGLAIGEGAAMFILEREDRARARGATPLARVIGWGSTQDAYRATAPRPDGERAREAIARAIRRAGIDPAQIDYINAHGTGTPLNDPAEVKAIRGALGEAAERVPVSSIKGSIGHLMAASGAIELASCLLPLGRGIIPGTAHHKERDPECDLDIVGESPRRADVRIALSNSFGFGGQNAAVIIERCD
ncbi:MAG: beta-ketoacyl-[acyl-carrier-protein] synthase family protein [Polyangiaceae bacterium]|nr:beta-ketoacyl-[acyl-carrier-protein] synthase family protein [Polyangiaceae bacterium]NUQ75847.1 beta-ketoacyl-[acyl-carrier-protein] synthase family protein [Polyangiaceae bacterium]